MRKPNLNEVLIKDNDNWLFFRQPKRIIIAERLQDVIPALQQIELHVKAEGLHTAGWVSYEAATAFDSALPSKPTAGFPFLWFGLYPKPQTVKFPTPHQTKEILNWQTDVDREMYNSAIARIKEYIANGRTYQVNYTMQIRADFSSDPWEFFLHLVQHQNQHAAYIDMGRYAVCSASPELFFQLDGNKITCRPMKGTIQRGRTTAEDNERSEWLQNSEKNRAENVMIVDMIRNDLGKVAKTGTVSVPALFQTERYPTLWQMTSTVTAETSSSVTDIFKALFPCASITGAPKVGTAAIIDELELTPRRIYTGTIGYLSPERKAKFNVAIRTALIDREAQKASYGIGGGIVWDSTNTDEYAEALLKARVLTDPPQPEFSLLETMLWTPDEGYFLREKHIERLLDSANYFDFPVSRDAIESYLNKLAAGFFDAQRVRILLSQVGDLQSEHVLYQKTEQAIKAALATMPIDSNNVFLFHKTTERSIYEQARLDHPAHDDVLLHNEQGDLTEFTIGNLVVELDGELLTPPISCGVLAGTFRAHLLESGLILERMVRIDQLKDCTRIFRINSVRRWERVEMSAFQ